MDAQSANPYLTVVRLWAVMARCRSSISGSASTTPRESGRLARPDLVPTIALDRIVE